MIEVKIEVKRRSVSVPVENFVGLPPGGNDYDVPIRLNGGIQWSPQSGGGGGGTANLSITFSTTTAIIANSAGTGVTVTAATASQAGVMTNAMFVKLRDIATGATANAADAYLLNRDNHTGAQAISTITGLQSALDYFSSELNNKVTVVVGKQLSTEDYTTSEKNKLAAIAAGATANAADAQLRDRSTHTGQQAISTITNLQTTLDAKLNASLVGVAGGLVPLDNNALIPSIYLPSFVDDVLEFANLAAFPAIGESGKIYVALDTNKTYRWGGSSYTFITSGAVDSVAGKTGVVTLVKGDVGLGNVDNTSDANKPVSTAQAAAIALKENAIAAGSVGQYWAYDKTWKTLNAAAIGLSAADISTALGYTPYNAANPAGYITANQTITITGDASGSGTTAITLTIGNNKVTNAMLAQVATKTFKGRTSSSTGNVEDLTPAQATAMLDTFTPSLKGLVPAPTGSGSTKFLREDGSWQVPAGGGGSAFDPKATLDIYTDFLANTSADQSPFLGTAVSSGTISAVAGASLVPGHPGICLVRSSTSANSGYRFNVSPDMIVLKGGELFDFIFHMPFSTSGTTLRFGFHDSTSVAAPVDAAMIEVTTAAGTVVGKTSNNNSSSQTTGGTLSANTWYQGRIELNSDATLATFSIYLMDGTLVWQQTLNANIPKTAGRAVGAGFTVWDTGTTANDLLNADFMRLVIPVAQRGLV